VFIATIDTSYEVTLQAVQTSYKTRPYSKPQGDVYIRSAAVPLGGRDRTLTIEIDNNPVERTIRLIALNLKNALFEGHEAGVTCPHFAYH